MTGGPLGPAQVEVLPGVASIRCVLPSDRREVHTAEAPGDATTVFHAKRSVVAVRWPELEFHPVERCRVSVAARFAGSRFGPVLV